MENQAQNETQPTTIPTLMEVTETVKGKDGKGKRQWRENKPVTLFTLGAFIKNPPAYTTKEVDIQGDAKQVVVSYENDADQWLYDSIRQRVFSLAGMRFRADEAAPTTLDELLEKRAAGSQWLADFKAFKEAIKSYAQSLGKSDKYIAGLIGVMEPKVLRESKESYQNAVADMVNGYQEANPEEAIKHESTIARIAEALAKDEDWISE